jgi:hypothetical protein
MTRNAWRRSELFEPQIVPFAAGTTVGEDGAGDGTTVGDGAGATGQAGGPGAGDLGEVGAAVNPRVNWQAIDYMNQYIDNDLVNALSNCTNVRSVEATGRSLNTTAAEIHRFLGASIFMSCIGFPRVKMYWQRDTRMAQVADVMVRDRYFKLRSSLKVVVDNDVSDDARKSDRFWKVRPLVERVRQGCLKLQRPRDVSIDEQMIPFTGACPYKQYIPSKPNPVGLKNFVLASPEGLVLDFVIYQGADTYRPVPPEVKIGAGGLVIAHLSETLSRGTCIYCDRYFTGAGMIRYMLTKDIYITGTVMKNRLPKDVAKLKDDKALAKMGRGACEVLVSNDHKVAVTTWFDNKPIIMASSIHSKHEEDTCRRWSKKDNDYVTIKRPLVIREYNSKMGGVDLCDRMMSFYRMKARTKKWTLRTLLHFVDLALVNSWLLYRADCVAKGTARRDIYQFLEFRIRIAKSYLSTTEPDTSDIDSVAESDNSSDADNPPPTKRRRIISALPRTPQRKSQAKHMPEIIPDKNSMRCRNVGCKKKTKIRCIACNVCLCLRAERNCFLEFHSR